MRSLDRPIDARTAHSDPLSPSPSHITQCTTTVAPLPVRPALDVGREVVADEAAGAEVDELDLAAAEGLDHDVLGLHVAVDQVQRVDVGQC